MINRSKTILAFVVFCVGAEYHWNKKLDNGETISALCGACRDQKVQTALGKCWQKTGRCQYGCIDGKCFNQEKVWDGTGQSCVFQCLIGFESL